MSNNATPMYGGSIDEVLSALRAGADAQLRLNEFIITLASIMSQLKAERNKETAIARLENLRKALLIALGRENEYYIITPDEPVGPRGLTRDKITGKISLEKIIES